MGFDPRFIDRGLTDKEAPSAIIFTDKWFLGKNSCMGAADLYNACLRESLSHGVVVYLWGRQLSRLGRLKPPAGAVRFA